jgi:hypothetical protein
LFLFYIAVIDDEIKLYIYNHVDATADPTFIVEHFADYFSKACSNLNVAGAETLKTRYDNTRYGYCGMPDNNKYLFDAELVEHVIINLSRGKAAGLDCLTAEHLQFCHPLLPGILAKLFNIIIRRGHVPNSFGQSYTVPIPKNNNSYSKSLNVEDFRGISISCVLSKVFEHCILDRYQSFFITSDNQFGFKKGSGCSHAIYTLRSVVDHYNSRGTTVNLCALDLTKAFDKMNHHGLFCKLMGKCIPLYLLKTFECWFSKGLTCVRWGSVYSNFYQLTCGIRQGGVLSPYFFASYIDDIVDKVNSHYNLGCYFKGFCVSLLLYADDIIIIAPTVMALQKLFNIVEAELTQLDMKINANKSHCIRIGPRHNFNCADIITSDGDAIQWTEEIRYLGIFIVTNNVFCCNHSNAKRSFYRTFNSIFSKVGRIASEDVIIQLVKTKCMPAMLYGLDVCCINKSQINSLQYAVTGMLMKVFNTKSRDIVEQCTLYFNFLSVDEYTLKRQYNFLFNFVNRSTNFLSTLFSAEASLQMAAVSARLCKYYGHY